MNIALSDLYTDYRGIAWACSMLILTILSLGYTILITRFKDYAKKRFPTLVTAYVFCVATAIPIFYVSTALP
jgi:hypothetical protein